MRSRALFACLASLLAVPAAAEEQLIDGIAAQVGGDIVLVSEVMQMVGPVEAQIRKQGASRQEIARLRAEGLEHMIERRLIEQMVEETELYASDVEVDETIARIAAQNQINVEELRESVVSQGLSYEEYRAEIKGEIERRKVVSAMVGSNAAVEEEEIRRLYTQRFADQPEGGTTFHLRQILVTHGEEAGRSKAQACARVQAALDRIVAGADFRAVASQVSEVAPERGGDIGLVHADTAAGWMKRVVADLEPGQVSDVLEPPFPACALLQLVAREEFEPIDFEMARPMLEQELAEKRLSEARSEWMEVLRERTFIERKGYFADAARFQRPRPEDPGSTAPPSLTPEGLDPPAP